MAIRFNSSPNKPERHLTPSPNKSQAKAGCWTRNAKMRDYVVRRRSADIDCEPDGENYLSRTVYEDVEFIDVGLLDSEGNQILARKRMDPIGFVRFKSGS